MEIDQDTISDLVVQFTRLMNKYQKLEKTARYLGTGDPLYPSELHIIRAIGKQPGVISIEISHAFGITKGAVSQVVTRLVKKGYVEKSKSHTYSKEVTLTLTAKGKKAFVAHERLHASLDASFRRFLMRLSREQAEGFKKIITHIERHLDEYSNSNVGR